MLGEAVACAREPGLRALLVVLELLILDCEEPLPFEARESGLDLGEQGLDAVQVRIEVDALRGGPLELVVVLADAREAFHEAPTGDRAHRDDLVDVALLDEVVAVAREPRVREEAVDLGLGRALAVDVEVRVSTRPGRSGRASRTG